MAGTSPPVAKQTHNSVAGGFLLRRSVKGACNSFTLYYILGRSLAQPLVAFSPHCAAGGFLLRRGAVTYAVN